MKVSKTTNVTLPASASWRIEKFSLLELFKTIEDEYTALIPASENYRTTVVVCRDISDETRYTLEEFKKHFSDSTPFKSITLLCTNALEGSAYLYLDTESILYKTPYQCYISISSSSLTEAEAEDFLKKMTALAISFYRKQMQRRTSKIPASNRHLLQRLKRNHAVVMMTTQTTITQTASATRKGLHSGISPKNWDCLSPLWVALLPFFLLLAFAVARSTMII